MELSEGKSVDRSRSNKVLDQNRKEVNNNPSTAGIQLHLLLHPNTTI